MGTIGFYIYCHRISELEAELLLVRRHTIAHTNHDEGENGIFSLIQYDF